MNRISLLVLFLTLVFINQASGQIPIAKKISEFQKTDFVPTLEHNLLQNRNAVYCASFLYAWDEIRNTIPSPLRIDSALHDLVLVNNSRSFVNTLNRNEYSSTGAIKGKMITLSSEFFKSLPFEDPLIGNEHLTFDNTKVSSFGIYGDWSADVEILYYKEESDFIIKLKTKDKEHEIILYMPSTTYSSMAAIIADVARKREMGLKEKTNDTTRWKYSLTVYDVIDIPELAFNIDGTYTEITNNRFNAGAKKYQISTAKQRVGFFLNEKGAEINTDTTIEIVFAEPVEGEQSKEMIFDKPFFLMLKRVNNNNPYFGLWVANTELMVKH